MSEDRRDAPFVYVIIGALLLAVFGLDLATALGIAVWILYVVPIAASLFTRRSWVPLAVGILSALLLIVGYFASPDQPIAALRQMSLVNRSLAFVTLVTFGGIGRQFVSAKVRLGEQDWIRAGQAGLATRMQGEQDIGALARSILSYLAEYLGARVGSVYVANGGGTFVREGGFALANGAGEERAVVNLGETLVGQAALDERMVVIDDVPEDYAHVRSGVGEAKPRSLVLLPTKADGAVNAVVELGFFYLPTSRTRELLAGVSHAVAVAIRSAQYRQRQAELLEETQRQTEELQVQQEELRVANEELEEQSKALEEVNARLEEQTRTLGSQKEDLAGAQVVLRHKADELARASRYKSEFLANMSHELRTPLNSSLILSKLLIDNKDGNLSAEQVKYAESIYSAGNDLLALINDILDLSKIEAGKVDLDVAEVSIARFVEKLALRFEPLTKNKRLAFSVVVDPSCGETIETDEQRLQQVLTNLLSNAIKFTEAGSVRLRVSSGPPGQIVFSVEDTGIGIAEHQHDIIFEAFRQADGTTNRRFAGTGLGLSISRELASLLGGEIRLRSTPGKGSEFSVVLPNRSTRSAPRRRSAPSLAAPEETKSPLASVQLIEDDRKSVADASRTILVIEDDPRFAEILRDLAREMDFKCVVAGAADEGLRLAREFRPVAIVLDVGLPDHSGLTVLELLKRDPSTRHTPVHIVSVHDHRHTARELGAIGYTLKPVQREALAAAFLAIEGKIAKRNKSVLVVEDDEVQREAITKLLAADDVSIVAVPNATEALERLRCESFDCVVLDLMLPEVDGFELLATMSADESRSFPPIIVYTARTLSLDEEHILRRLSKSVIVKGARSPERLLEEVTLFLHQVESELPADKQRMLQVARSREAAFEGRHILLVEDDVRNIFALTSLLEPKGVKLDLARNGKEALDRLAKGGRVDVVLMDIMMPEMDGLEATRAIRRDDRWRSLPVIALTAKAMPDDRRNCLAAGANDYIAKPIDPEKLLSLLRVWMPK